MKRVGEGQDDFPKSGLDVWIAGCAKKIGKQDGMVLRTWGWEWERVDLRPVFNADLFTQPQQVDFLSEEQMMVFVR